MSSKTYLFRDRFSGSDMFSVAQPYKIMPDNDAIYIVKSENVVKNSSGEVNVGRPKFDFGMGAAEGAEAEDEPLAEGDTVVNNIVDTYGLSEITYSKKDFLGWLKPYLVRVKSEIAATRPDRLTRFMEGAQKFAQLVTSTFDDWAFYVNVANDYEAMIALAKYEGESTVPEFYFFRDGLLLCFPGTGSKIAGEALVPQETATREGVLF